MSSAPPSEHGGRAVVIARRLILLLGDQLTQGLGALGDIDPVHDHVLLAEVMEEASHVPHHPKKIVLIFSAMRHFAEALRKQGITVHYDPG